MGIAIAIYIVLLVVFLVVSSLILRHAVKFSYLSHRFKYIVGAFSVIALAVILFSVVLLVKMDVGSTGLPFKADTPSTPPTNDSGSLNF